MIKFNATKYYSQVISFFTVAIVFYPVLLSVPAHRLYTIFEEITLYKIYWLLPIMLLLYFVFVRFFEISWSILFDRPYVLRPKSTILSTLLYGVLALKRSNTPVLHKSLKIEATAFRLVLSAAFLSFIGSALLDTIIQIVRNQNLVAPAQITSISSFVAVLIALAIISPLLETIIMAAILEILTKVLKISPRNVTILSAAGWAAVHGMNNHPLQAFSMFWVFFILTALYFRSRGSFEWLASALILLASHSLNNFLALCFIAAKQTLLIQ
ncbi:hypothetical protein [Massilia sp. LC238]|uniref:hypothetical protein n=1 Tax=Massilia sp. LC238 TaxID=1502852 RepID=UPI0004E44239|nr:hypothetical protein [Massilia sp. LC238]KFC66195.1 hypothetical protein FG94_03396 [Massilia sp. LC238]